MEKLANKKLEKFYDTVAACNRCGFCTSYCPTYNATGSEVHSPRGRNQAFRAIIEGNIKNPLQVKESIDSCLLCGECTSVCFSEVPTAQLMVQARHLMSQTSQIPWGLKWILNSLLTNPPLLRRLLKFAFLGKRLGVAWILKKSGILKKLAPTLASADDLIKKAPGKLLHDYKETKPYQESRLEDQRRNVLAAQKKVNDLKKQGKPASEGLLKAAQAYPQRPKVAFFPACGSQYLNPNIGLSTIKLFEHLKVDMMLPETICCGLPGASYGILERVQFYAKKNIDQIEQGNYEKLVVDDSSCSAHLKDYPLYFSEDKSWLEKAQKLNERTFEFSTFLIEAGLEASLQQKGKWSDGPVAYHDPCKAQYGQKVTAPPRRLIQAIPNIKLVPVAEADQCCGGAGTYSFVHPEMSQDVLKSKIENIIASGAKTVVSSSASCLTQISFGLRKAKSKIKVLHISEFLSKALGL